ncbi:MAG: hypothetical protein KF685_08340 [Acidobacteria bacterium]|nr:hypothetical protein [Acidobacteriota bacterium]
MALIEFYKTNDVYVSEAEAWEILVWFFGGNAGITPSDVTYNDRSFAQALMFEAIRASKQISFVEGLWRATANPTKSLKSMLKQIAKLTAKALWEHLKPADLEDPKIYEMVKNALARNWRSPWQIRVATGDPVY